MRSSSLHAAIFLVGALPGIALANPDTRSVASVCVEARRVVDELARGRIAEVWDLVEAGDLHDLQWLGYFEEEPANGCGDVLVEKLPRVISRTDDDRIVARILDELNFDEAPAFLPVLRKALRHPSPVVRRHMLHAVATGADPQLAPEIEARFAVERDPAARRELVRALAATESRRFLPELRDLARGVDAPLRHAAIETLLDLADTDAVPMLAAIASAPQNGDEEYAERITSALASWNDVPGIDDVLAGIGRAAPEQVARSAILQLAERGAGAVGALSEIAAARERSGEQALVEEAQNSIRALQEDGSDGVISVKFVCGGIVGGPRVRPLPLVLDGGENTATDVMVVSPADARTIRCWDAPGFVWPGETRSRVAAGTQVTIVDEFDWGGERWLAGESAEELCWLRATELTAESEAIDIKGGRPAYEFDVPADDLNSWAASDLERRGWLRVLSVDETVAALRLEVEEPTRDSVAALIDVRLQTNQAGLAAGIDQWLWRYASPWIGDQVLGNAIPRRDPRWPAEEDAPEDE